MRYPTAAILLATAALAGCDNNPDAVFPAPGGETPPAALMSVLEFARSLIGTRSCDTTAPAEVNGREFADSETALTDPGAVNLGCSA